MIGYFGDIIFETSDKKICNFNDFKQAASANYSEHSRYRKKSEREFISPNNEGVSFTMKIRAGHGVRPRIMKDISTHALTEGDNFLFHLFSIDSYISTHALTEGDS